MIEEGQKTVQWTVFPTRDVTLAQLRDQHLLDMGAETLAVDRPVDHPGGHDPVMSQGRDEGHCVPMPEGRAPDQPLAPRRPASQGCHVGLGPGFVNEHQPFQVDAALTRLPALPFAGNVRPLLLTGQRGFL